MDPPAPDASPPRLFAPVFSGPVFDGRCVVLALPAPPPAVPGAARLIPDEAWARLRPAERTFAEGLPPARRLTWVGGRLALRAALAEHDAGAGAGPLLADGRGAPLLPAGLTGSISHKDHLAVAVAAADARGAIGVDLEDLSSPPSRDIAGYVLDEGERGELAALGGPARAAEVLTRFAAKEAIYKAVDRFVKRYVSFHEAITRRGPDGRLSARLALRAAEGPFTVELDELRLGAAVVVTARVRR
jgi:4'-phosphopantetheinyl transferase EntD